MKTLIGAGYLESPAKGIYHTVSAGSEWGTVNRVSIWGQNFYDIIL